MDGWRRHRICHGVPRVARAACRRTSRHHHLLNGIVASGVTTGAISTVASTVARVADAAAILSAVSIAVSLRSAALAAATAASLSACFATAVSTAQPSWLSSVVPPASKGVADQMQLCGVPELRPLPVAAVAADLAAEPSRAASATGVATGSAAAFLSAQNVH